MFELFRLLFIIVCQRSVVFPHTKQKEREVEEREVCFENNNNRERERVRESVSGRCFVAALGFVRAFFAFLFVSSVFPTKQIG